MKRYRIYIILAAVCALSQTAMAAPILIAQAKSAGTSPAAAGAKQPAATATKQPAATAAKQPAATAVKQPAATAAKQPAATAAKQPAATAAKQPAATAAKQTPAAGKESAKSDTAKSTATTLSTDPKKPVLPTNVSSSNNAPVQPQLIPVDPSKLAKDNAVMQAQAELDIKPDPVADVIFKAFHYITIAALVGSVVFGTMWYIRHKKRLASGFYDEEDDEDDEDEEEHVEKSKKSAHEKTAGVTPNVEDNSGKLETTSDSTPQPVGSDEPK